MANAKNILVGAARVWISAGAGQYRPALTSANFPYQIADGVGTNLTTASNTSVNVFLGSTGSGFWRDIGYTSNGVEISYEPSYSDVMVDQLLDAARLFKQAVKVTMRTEFDEGTLENIHVVFGQNEQFLNSAGNNADILTDIKTTGGSAQHLNIQAGAIGDAPTERSLVFVGVAPGFQGETIAQPVSVTTSVGTGTTLNSAATIKKERVYVARRAVQTETVTHSLKRDGVTVFPVSFRCLPEDGTGYADTTGGKTNGSEYGIILDRIYG
jgi:hypothetical protein